MGAGCSPPPPVRAAVISAAAAAVGGEADVLPGPGGEAGAVLPGRLEEPRGEPPGGSQLDVGGIAFQVDVGWGFASGAYTRAVWSPAVIRLPPDIFFFFSIF